MSIENRIPKKLRQELDESGVPYHLDTGGKHLKIFVAERLAAILPKSKKALSSALELRAGLNCRAQVRRAIREAKEAGQHPQ